MSSRDGEEFSGELPKEGKFLSSEAKSARPMPLPRKHGQIGRVGRKVTGATCNSGNISIKFQRSVIIFIT